MKTLLKFLKWLFYPSGYLRAYRLRYEILKRGNNGK